MRILHISTRLILGGSQENTVLSCEAQARAGHEVHLAFGPIYGPEGSLLARVEAFNVGSNAAPGGSLRSITTHVLPSLVREIHPWKDHVCFHRELRPLIRALRPDIVHTHSSKAGILGRWAAWKEGGSDNQFGVVHTIHGPPFMPVEGGSLARNRTRISNHLYTLAERFAAKRCHVIVSVADAMTQQFLARRIGKPAQYVTVRSGMEVGHFLQPAAPSETREAVRAALGLAPNDFVIGTVARLAQHKGHDDILDALREDLLANPHWKLLWVGDGWWRERLVAKARALGLHAASAERANPENQRALQVICTGLVPPERIPALVRAMDVLAHPSSREGLPRTVPQALLCGVCPVAYDADGTREACREMETGRLVPTGDIAGLRGAVRWCAEHPQERAALAARGREWCAREFSVEAMAAGLEKVYARATSRQS